MKKIILMFIVVLLICPMVNSSVVLEVPPTAYSNGGLMDSAWPMFHHDNKHTGRSPFGVLGNAGVVKWKFHMFGLTISSPAIDKNGTIYIGGRITLGGDSFLAINPDGSLKWSFDVGDIVLSSPALASDGTIYVGSDIGYLYAFNPNGTLKWRFKAGGPADWVRSSPSIADDGTIYFGVTGPVWDIGRIYAVNPDGTEKWHYDTGFWIYSSAAIDDNGCVYIGSHDGNIYAIYSNGTLKWKYQTRGCVKSPPTIGDDGTIYVGSWDNYLYALSPNGTLKWQFDTGNSVDCSPALDLDGNIYVGSISDWFYSVSPDGVENWRFKTGDAILSSPVIDKFGVIYICSEDGNLYVLNPDSSIRWIFDTGVGGSIESSPVIGEDGSIYVCSKFFMDNISSRLYAINVVENNNPNKPVIEGPLNGHIDIEYFYAANCIDMDNDNISYFFDWGDGTNTGWTGFVSSGTTVNISHIWDERGFYDVKVKAKDIWGHESEWSEPLTVFIEKEQPDKPTINGPNSGKIRENQIFTIVTIDYQGDNVEYYIDWGDETNSGWIGPYSSGENITVNHSWNNRGTFNLRVKARDIYGHESDWSTLKIIMPKTRIHNPIIERLMRMLERFPFFEKILNQIFL